MKGSFYMKICPKCQNQMDDNAVFCTSCGAQYTETAQQSTPVQEPQQTATNANDNVNTNSANNTNNGAPVPPPPPQPYVQPYAPAYDPNDHTAEFDPKDISDNKIYAMLGYLLGTGGIIIALLGAKDSPYAKFHVKQAIKNTITLDYGEVTDISPDIRLTLHNAGHILGSAISHMHIGDGAHNLVYTGDFKYEPSRLLEPATIRFPRAETVIMESTYGGREDIQPSRNNAEKEMMKTIYKTLKRGGKVLVPVFAVGRAQELMIVLEEYMRHGMVDEVPIHLDGMIWEATAVHTARPEYLSKDLRDQIFHMGRNPFISESFNKVQNNAERKQIVEGEPSIILSTSGMMTGGNSVEYFKWLCEDKNNSIIFVGYQSEGSLGRKIQKGHKEIPLEDETGKKRIYNVKMDVKTIEGFSGHSNRRQLMEFAKRLHPRPDKIITCHGDPYKTVDLASSIHRSYKVETKTPLILEATRLQ